MSKITFEVEWGSKSANFYASDPIELIEKHGGEIDWNGEIVALRARLKEAEAAIGPFASLSGWHESYNGENPIDMNMRATEFGQQYFFGQLKLSQFRAAAAWLAGEEGE